MVKWNNIYQGDNLEWFSKLRENRFDFNLVLTDAPYNLFKDFGNETDSQSDEDYLSWLNQRILGIGELITPRANIVWFCAPKYVGDIQLAFKNAKINDNSVFHQRRLQIWYYENGMSRQVKEPVSEFEPFW